MSKEFSYWPDDWPFKPVEPRHTLLERIGTWMRRIRKRMRAAVKEVRIWIGI